MFLVQITALVAAAFTNALGYDATFRAAMVTFLNTQIVTLVSSTNPEEEYDQAVEAVIDASVYAAAIGDTPVLIRQACEDTINLAKVAYTNPAISSQILFSSISQALINDPGFDQAPAPNNYGEVPVLTRLGVGTYQLQFPTLNPFIQPAKVSVNFKSQNLNIEIGYAIPAPNTLIFTSALITYPAGVYTANPTDSLISQVPITIITYP